MGSRRKTRAKELARRWRKRKHLRQKAAAIRNKAEKAERIFQSFDRQTFTMAEFREAGGILADAHMPPDDDGRYVLLRRT